MKLSEAREFIDRLYNSEDGMTDDHARRFAQVAR